MLFRRHQTAARRDVANARWVLVLMTTQLGNQHVVVRQNFLLLMLLQLILSCSLLDLIHLEIA